jgi:glycosyltransferase involved in cell wall biosynthesis
MRPSRRSLSFVVPGDLDTPTGGYGYDRRIIQGVRGLGWQVDVANIGDGFPFPTNAQRTAALKRLAAIPPDRPIVFDGLALGVLPEVSELGWRSLVALVHQPLALDPGLSAPQARTLRETERSALSMAARVVVTSTATARIIIADYDVPDERVSVVRPGTDPAPMASGSRDGVTRLLSVGSIVPVKGYDVLLKAVSTLADMPWTLTIAGDRTRDPAAASRLDADIAACGLSDRVAVLGAVSAEGVCELYSKSDLFVLASRFEGYGMALAEAIAHGLPVVSTTAGAIPDTVPEGAGVLVPPDDAPALANALRELIGRKEERQRLAKSAREAASLLSNWDDSALLFASVIETAARTPCCNRSSV